MVHYPSDRTRRLSDTIAAIATPPGQGSVGIVRVSGPFCRQIAEQVTGRVPPPRYATFCHFRNRYGEILDQGLILYFPGPHSFTGEDVLELQGHGGPAIMDWLLSSVLQLGVRLARPGEFSERAFLNNKIDLAQAEAIADLIESASEQAARSALRSLHGEFSAQIQTLREQLTELRCVVEANIDFSDEDIDFIERGMVAERLKEIQSTLQSIHRSARQGALLREGVRVVLAGRPNVGKSSLHNRLAGFEAAIVTDVPGTTRDLLRENITIDGLPIHLSDTAGLHNSKDTIEQEGMRRTREELIHADHVLLVADDQSGLTEAEQAILDELPDDVTYTLIFNKIDLSGAPAGRWEELQGIALRLSALTGAGMDLLCQRLKECAGFDRESEGCFSARRRHLEALQRAGAAVVVARKILGDKGAEEILAEELRQAQNALAEITGEYRSDDLLGEIFSTFCIGK
ncbi:tRNA uridine-5-carboxymethylaminomethyl(34) synthesis GTPase MnmE [Nitrosococcus oceani]|uniref:tRNA modification GTPase MnmE n=2 Tax=Nitrosococcus oceani TaxID=1229 RepID=MNME_NITOC|nr:tRNA uridine-5-carboxymethylaminomethyl(34) synthesis GTPase MnmE [Nitrosococcus oceani]Q3J6L9.1 RecName: Full=tRNA modification GTPase MnmE [Nitrosococcus oceani ATCC 19707]ABA59527.1 tRNA modification GTPase trmE [Nitrosococcus oceani ATCC 19707]KFI18093.1 tRNA modification GTPase MnmE [Nitrosococcus oceani C-27]KFI24092.1 tRNA modification GTPase MnmE [Nitrosococcus oceani]